MKYKGTELKEFTSDKPVVFDPQKKMLLWDNEDVNDIVLYNVLAYLPGRSYPVISQTSTWKHCAEIPEEPKPRRATNLELAKWVAQGNGFVRVEGGYTIYTNYGELTTDNMGKACPEEIVVRKWDDTEWHEPTADYMGLEG